MQTLHVFRILHGKFKIPNKAKVISIVTASGNEGERHLGMFGFQPFF
jgi:hypothetical protein